MLYSHSSYCRLFCCSREIVYNPIEGMDSSVLTIEFGFWTLVGSSQWESDLHQMSRDHHFGVIQCVAFRSSFLKGIPVFTIPWVYYCLIMVGVTAGGGIIALNAGLKRYEAMYIIPL